MVGVNLALQMISMVRTTLACKEITLSGVEAPDVTPSVMGPSGSQFSFSTNSPCYHNYTVKQFKDKYLKLKDMVSKSPWKNEIYALHLHSTYTRFCFQDLFSAHCRSNMRGFHGPLQSLVGVTCCLSSTHLSPTWDLSFHLPAYTLRLDAPENETKLLN